MRILHILNHVQNAGNGIVNVAVDLACLQARDHHEVAIASAGGSYEPLLAEFGVHHFTLDQSRTPPNLLRAGRHFRRFIREWQPDVVHAHMMTGVVLARILRQGTRYGLVATVHNEFQRSAVLMGLADRVIAVSQAVAQSMQQRGIPGEKLRVVLNGTLGSPRQGDLPPPRPLQRPAITTVAGMYYRKGIAELIQAFGQLAQQFPTVHLYLVGDGPDRPAFEALAAETELGDRIHFEGFQPQPQAYLQSTDIFVLASRKEPCALVLSEAREMGCAMITTDVDGMPEGLDHGKAGLLVPPENPQVLAQTIAQLLTDQDLLYLWRQRARQNLDRLRVDRVHRETLEVYRELVLAPSPRIGNKTAAI